MGVQLVAEETSGFPVPENRSNLTASGTRYRRAIQATVPASLQAVIDFYRRELGQHGWEENVDKAKVQAEQAALSFSGKDALVMLQLRHQGKETVIELVARNTQKAQQDGVAPKPGQARLILANEHSKEAVIVINGKEHKIVAGTGAKNPRDAYKLDLAAGQYKIQIKVPSESVQTRNAHARP